MRSVIHDRWQRAMAGIPTLEAMAAERRAVAKHLSAASGHGRDPDNPMWRRSIETTKEADALDAMVEYLRSLPSLTAEPVAERFATKAQARDHGATHMLLVRVPGLERVG